jgi:tyrosine-protein kinase Etk/Wzc
MAHQTNGLTNSTVQRVKPDWLLIFARNRSALFGWVFGAGLLFFFWTFILPQTYESTATVLPPERQGVGGMISSLLGNSAALDLLKGGASDNPTLDLFKTIVESRSVAEEVAQDQRVVTFLRNYDTTRANYPKILLASIQSEELRTGEFTLTVSVPTPRFPTKSETDSTRLMSAYIANKFVAELDRFNRDRLLTSARNTRMFVEKEYNDRVVQLDSAYRHLQGFQEAHQAISLPEQLAATVTAAAKLTGEIDQLQMQIGVEERELGPNSPHMQGLHAELEAERSELQKYDDGGAGEYILALKNVPELSREFAQYLREVKVLEQVTAYLRQELEQDRISEQRDLPSLQVLDPARPPMERSSPIRIIYTIVGVFLGFVFGSGRVLYKTFRQDVNERPQAHYRFINLMQSLRRGKKAPLVFSIAPQTTDSISAEKLLRKEQEA